VNVVVIRYGAQHKEKKHKHLPSKHSFTLIENDKSIQINQTIWRMLRVGAPNFFFKRTTTCQKARQGSDQIERGESC